MVRKRISWNHQLVRIYERGIKARKDGRPIGDNPYRLGGGNLQMQRRRYWSDGWRFADRVEKGDEDEILF